MKPILPISAVVVVLAALAAPCFAMMSIAMVTPERAKAMGMEVRAGAAGPEDVRVELQFATKGELKGFARADLELRDGTKAMISATLREERPAPDRVSVSFAASRAELDHLTVRVVTESGPRTRTGYDLRIKDFVDLTKLQ